VANVDGRSGDQVLLAPPFIATEPEVETIVETLALAIDDALIEIGAA
jgi:adenosylmethionine-8-amino-7-oxononanoate aminotransferase